MKLSRFLSLLILFNFIQDGYTCGPSSCYPPRGCFIQPYPYYPDCSSWFYGRNHEVDTACVDFCIDKHHSFHQCLELCKD